MSKKIHDEQLKLDVIINGNDAQKKLGELQQKKRDLKAANDDLRKAKALLVAQGKKETEEFKNLSDQLKENNQSLQEARESEKKLTKEIGLSGLTSKQLYSEKKKLKQLMDSFTPNSEQWRKYAHELSAVDHRLSEVKDEYNEVKDSLNDGEAFGKAQESFANILTGIKTGDLGALKTGFSGLAGGIKTATKSSIAFIATPLGATLAVLAAVIGAGKMWFDYNIGLSKTLKLTEQLTGLQGQDLSDYRAQIQGVASTFDKEYNEVLKAANSLSKQMGITQEEALNKIEQGFARGADANGDFLDKVKEYPVHFKNAGYTAQEFVDVATQEVKGGIYNDKLIDTIKEIDLSLRDMDKAQQDVLKNNFGKKFADELIKGIKSGKTTTKQAFDSIIAKSKEMGLNVLQQQKLVADLMKSAGEDAGGYKVVIEQLNLAFDKQNKKLSESEKATLRLSKANKEQEQAMADLFDASDIGFTAMITNLESYSKEIFTNTLRGLSEMITSQEKLNEIAGLKGQGAAVKQVSENMKLYGTTATEEVDSMLKSAKKNIDRIKKDLDNVGFFSGITGEKGEREKSLSKAKSFYDELLKIKTGKSEKFKEVNKPKEEEYIAPENPVVDPKKEATKKRQQLLENQKKYRETVLLGAKTLLEQEAAAYNERLNKAGIFGKKQHDLTKGEIAVKELLSKEHQAEIAKIELQSTNEFIALKNKKYQEEKQNRQTNFNNELASINKLESAKKLLKEKLSDEELAKIVTLEDAKVSLKKQYENDELERKSEYLNSLINVYSTALNSGNIEGVNLADTILTDEQKEALNEKLDEVKLKLSEIAVEKNKAAGGGEDGGEFEGLEGVDILGSNPEQWDAVFNGLDTTAQKVASLGVVLQGLQQAWGMYNKFVSNGEQKQLKELEKSNNEKKKQLKKQLDNNLISKEEYNSKIESLDVALDKKKAEIEYKKAKREQTSALFNIAANTALGIMKAVASFPITGGMPWTAIIGAMGAVQAGLVLSAGLPKKGYEDGLYPVTRDDGKTFQAKLGTTKTGLVTEPTLMDGKYLAGERSTARNPEMIIDDVTFSKLDPNVIQYITNVHKGIVPGHEKGIYKAPKNSTESFDYSDDDEADLKSSISTENVEQLLKEVVSGIDNIKLVFGYEEAQKIFDLQKENESSKENGILSK
ncbi:phage tail tape measure protein [Tenacibaculum finnmarkense]|uniref:phage tail tape measure protein n=1 Tax=Tenacibaculum finnmarkense TaxID=2781243 RepID=UPI00187B4045|nr:phage tail tape measure protein [Tenacibaculum finnmarkense]MBE7649158.1 hypothetical protein [Tenacibaculum finnmarkense genomovar ulcerans]